MHLDSEHTPRIILTEDGSHSLFIPALQETYHSRHGAIREAQHVFIQHGLMEGLDRFPNELHILEVGFGTGLNAWLTYNALESLPERSISYSTLETHPLEFELIKQLNFAESKHQAVFLQMHQSAWNDWHMMGDFRFRKIKEAIQTYSSDQLCHVIYYDAFGPPSQPEMWTPAIFQRLFDLLENGGIFVTYCAKGQVRRDLMAAGFNVERLPGPPGKREMLRAIKPL